MLLAVGCHGCDKRNHGHRQDNDPLLATEDAQSVPKDRLIVKRIGQLVSFRIFWSDRNAATFVVSTRSDTPSGFGDRCN